MTEITLRATLTTGMRFDAETASGHHILLDSVSQSTEHDSGSGPMETLLAALAGCSGISMLSILRKKRQDITGYEIRVSGKQAETYPHVFTAIRVEHILTGHNLQEEAVQRALQLTEERYCSVSIMLSKATTLIQTFRIIETG
ncbi:MAG: OsmC family protein [Ktedonobacteraceae bacterium]|nr:OsmC family protein [Ktedonobacteraceae bacterium]MBV9712281.1 OsmC family protein [Ktedonobacteraceae bacterium]